MQIRENIPGDANEVPGEGAAEQQVAFVKQPRYEVIDCLLNMKSSGRGELYFAIKRSTKRSLRGPRPFWKNCVRRAPCGIVWTGS